MCAAPRGRAAGARGARGRCPGPACGAVDRQDALLSSPAGSGGRVGAAGSLRWGRGPGEKGSDTPLGKDFAILSAHLPILGCRRWTLQGWAGESLSAEHPGKRARVRVSGGLYDLGGAQDFAAWRLSFFNRKMGVRAAPNSEDAGRMWLGTQAPLGASAIVAWRRSWPSKLLKMCKEGRRGSACCEGGPGARLPRGAGQPRPALPGP